MAVRRSAFCFSVGILFLGEVFSPSRQTVGGDDLIGGRILTIGLVVEGHDLLGEALVEDVGIEDAALGDQALQGDIAIFLQEVDIGVTGTTRGRYLNNGHDGADGSYTTSRCRRQRRLPPHRGNKDHAS